MKVSEGTMKKFLKYFWGTIASPSKTFKTILTEKSLSIGLTPVVILGFLASITYFISYLYGASITMEELAAGLFFNEPFIPIPKETYRLWEAIFILPLYLTVWISLAGIATLTAKAFGGKGSFRKNLNVIGFAYFVPLYFFVIFDFILIGPGYSTNIAACRGLYGIELQSFVSAVGFLYIAIPFGIWAPILTVIAIAKVQKFSLWKATVVTLIALIFPNFLYAIFIR